MHVFGTIRVMLGVAGGGVVVETMESARGWSAETIWGSTRGPRVLVKSRTGFIVGATRPVGDGSSKTVVETGGGIEGIVGDALLVRSAWEMSTLSGYEVNLARGSRPIKSYEIGLRFHELD